MIRKVCSSRISDHTMSELEKAMEIRDLVDNTPLRNKLVEVRNWEKTMKQKEKDLKNKVSETSDSVPIRSRIKEKGKGDGDTPKVNGCAPPSGSSDALLGDNKEAVVEAAQKRSAALKLASEEKERGNKLVSAKDYKNAIPHYSKAIELNPEEPAFFLNRALCRLRLEDYREAIVDCDSALGLDKTLTKAYFRRMQSHAKLEMYDEAMGDCIQMIKMDSGNPDLRKEFDRIKQLKVDKESGKRPSLIIGGAVKKPVVEEVFWEPRPKKLWSKYGSEENEIRFQDKAPHLRSKKPLKRIAITETFSSPEPIETFPDHIVDKLFNNFTGESTSHNGPTASTSRSPTALFSPYTPLYGSFNAKSPVIATPPSPMSSSALNLSSCSAAERSIDDIFGSMSVAAAASKDQQEADQPIGCLPAPPSPPDPSSSLNVEGGGADRMLDDKTDVMKPVPAAPSPNEPATQYAIPKTGVQFSSVWEGLGEGQRFHFLAQCREKSAIIGKLEASLDDKLFTEILDCLHSYFCPKDLNVGDILHQLSKNSEIGILAMMMGHGERRQVDDLLSYVKGRQELTAEVLVDIEQAFSG